MTFVPSFVSEFPDNPVDDCVPSSGVMLADKITHNRYPASITEREALAVAMGVEVPGQEQGANAQQLCDGMRKRYGIALAPTYSWAPVAGALMAPNKGAALFGSYQKLPAYIRVRGNQPTFDGGHCIYAQGDGTGLTVLGDPLGNGMIGGVAVGDLKAFFDALPQAVIGTEQSATIVSYRLNVPASSTGITLTFFHVVRFTHTLYGAKRVTFAPRGSHATVRHGAPGFWMIVGGTLDGYYAVAGKSGPFTIQAVYSDGSLRPVNIAT